MARGTKRLRHALTLALLVAGAGDAWSARLDKTACADLNTELSSLLASGLKEDMDKGAAWGAANLSPERLAGINRVVELQGQLEFRCGSSPGRNVAKSPKGKSPGEKSTPDKAADSKTSTAKSNGEDLDDAASATKPNQNQKVRTLRRKRGSAATTPELPAVVPPTATSAAPPTAPATATTAKPVAEVDTTAAASAAVAPASPAPAADKTAATAPPAAAPPPQGGKVTPVSTAPQAASDAKVVPPVAPVTAPTTAPDQAGTPVPGPKKTAAQKAARRPARRDSSSAYVSPQDVNTFGVRTGN